MKPVFVYRSVQRTAQIKEIRAILKEDNSARACLNSARMSKKHANNLQLKMCQVATNQEEKYAFHILSYVQSLCTH